MFPGQSLCRSVEKGLNLSFYSLKYFVDLGRQMSLEMWQRILDSVEKEIIGLASFLESGYLGWPLRDYISPLCSGSLIMENYWARMRRMKRTLNWLVLFLDLMRRQEELRRMEELHNQEVQKRKQLELRQEEERRRREEEMRRQQEEMMRRQQEGFKGAFPDAREQEIRMGQMAMGGAMGINNRGAMPPAPVPTGTPAPPGPATMMPDGTLGLVIQCRALP